MTSVVIAAHNEATVIGQTLRTLLAGAPPGTLDVTVVANGCTDGTAQVAAAVPGVRVVELPTAGKPAALNAGDRAAAGFPRVYLDADIQVTAVAVATVVAALDGTHLAAAPRRELDLTGRPLLVRAYYAIHSRLPVFRRALFGRGAIAISPAGRSRFDRFPDVLGDDFFLDSRFGDHEKCEVPQVISDVAAPRRTADLVRRLARVRAGNAALRAGVAGVRPAERTAWLRQVVLPRPWLAPAAVAYVALTLAAAARSRLRPREWGQDVSNRATRPEGAGVD